MPENLRAESRKVQELQVTMDQDEKSYVFISYSSADWKEVLEEIVWEMQHRYGLRVYFDREFASSNEKWMVQIQEQMAAHCAAILSFVSPKYLTSYATLMEVLYSQVECKSKSDHLARIPLIPVLLNENRLGDFANKIPNEEKNALLSIQDNERNLLKMWADWADSPEYPIRDAARILKSKLSVCAELRKIDVSYACRSILENVGNQTLAYWESSRNTFFENLRSRIIMAAADRHLEPPFDPVVQQEVQKTQPVTMHTVQTAPVMAPQPKAARQVHRRASVTGNILYTFQGQTFCENQSDMMLRVFEALLYRHPEIREKATEACACVSRTDWKQYSGPEKIPSCFRTGRIFHFPEGDQLYVGTSLPLDSKLSQMATLFDLCGESPELLQTQAFSWPRKGKLFSRQELEAPEKKHKQGGWKESIVTYSLQGLFYIENQTEMMFRTISQLLQLHPDRRLAMAERLSCLALQPLESLPRDQRPSYFRSMRQVKVEGQLCSIGASYDLEGKLRQISIAIEVCGEPTDFFVLEKVWKKK